MIKKLIALSISSALSANIFADCSEIAVFSNDAEYFILDPEDLSVLEVGNLWWIGIRQIDAVLAGSTYEHTGIVTTRFIDVTSGSLMIPGDDRSPAKSLVIVEEMGARKFSQSEFSFKEISPNEELFWSKYDSSLLYQIRKNGRTNTITQMDETFTEISSFDTTELTLGSTNICYSNGSTIYAGLDNRLAIDESGNQSFMEINGLDREGGYRLLPESQGCKVLFGRIDEEDNTLVDGGVLDLTTGEVVSRFKRDLHTYVEIFDDGTKLFEQALEVLESDPPAYSRAPTGRFSVIDTSNGNILNEAVFNSPNMRIVGKQTCSKEDSERIILQDDENIYLVDMRSITVTASQAVPFKGKFFVY